MMMNEEEGMEREDGIPRQGQKQGEGLPRDSEPSPEHRRLPRRNPEVFGLTPGVQDL